MHRCTRGFSCVSMCSATRRALKIRALGAGASRCPVSLRRHGPAASSPAKEAKARRPGLPAATRRLPHGLRRSKLHREGEAGKHRAGLEAAAATMGLAVATQAPPPPQQVEVWGPPGPPQEEQQAVGTKAPTSHGDWRRPWPSQAWTRTWTASRGS